MSERAKPHNGRDTNGHFRVARVDADDTVIDPDGVDIIRDDVKKGGAVEDIGADAGRRAAEIGDLIRENREDVLKAAGKSKS
jgi:hypothetical protein